MQYAIIELSNQQYLLKPGDRFTSLGELGKVGDILKDVKTLLVKADAVEIGSPTVDYPVTVKVVEITKTDKLDIFKYRGKSRYRRHTGHRQVQTVLELVAEAKPAKKAAADKPAKPAARSRKKAEAKA